MSRARKSQWDFGELFPPEETRRVLSVSQLTTRVKQLLEQHLGSVWVTGEITNLRVQSSGHCYFTLKDAGSQVACVLFRGTRVPRRDLLEDGQKVVLQGDVTVYEARGQYQIIVRQVELQGLGALQAAFERLKQKLDTEGLFARERKRSIPKLPQCVGVVTSTTAAALRDVLHVVERRNPALELILAPCRVQGQGAAEEVAAAIRLLNEYAAYRKDPEIEAGKSKLDVILVTRGGGSLEDLWAFNEEVVARAIAASALPVVSAVGHEVDFTISDFVADLRAATPSAAAELLTEGVVGAREFIREAPRRLRDAASSHRTELKEELDVLLGRLSRAHPRKRLNEVVQRLDDLQGMLKRRLRDDTRRLTAEWRVLNERLLRSKPRTLIEAKRQSLQLTVRRLDQLLRQGLQMKWEQSNMVLARLRLLGPEQVLARGYSITTDAGTGQVIRDARQVEPGQIIRTRLHRGEIKSRTQETES